MRNAEERKMFVNYVGRKFPVLMDQVSPSIIGAKHQMIEVIELLILNPRFLKFDNFAYLDK